MPDVKRILAPTDFSSASLVAVEQAARLALEFGAELILLYVVPPIPTLPADMNYTFQTPDYNDSLQSAATEKLAELEEEHVPEGIPVRRLICFGDPAGEIVKAAEEEKCDWIVISTHGHTGWKHLVFGSVAEKVVRLACCPVLSIRCPEEEKLQGGE